MNKKQALSIYNNQIEKIKAYYLVLTTTSYDRMTIAPKKGNDYRNKMMSIIQGEVYDLSTDKKFIEAILYLSKLDLGEVLNREIKLAKKDVDDIIKFSKEEIMEFSLAQMEGNDYWLKAKEKKDYSIFKPYLLKLIELSKVRANRKNPNINPYDVLLDEYEEGMNIKKYDEFFKLIKKELVPLIKKINKKKNYINDSFLYKIYPIDKQEIFMDIVKKYINFDPSWGYMGVSEHPYTMGISRNDVRVTTNYDIDNITGAFYSIVHECGHGFYEHQVSPKFDKYLYLRNMSSGIHESQSRFLENYLGRRKAFFTNLYPKLQELFPENLKNVSLNEFILAVNVSKCSLIRTDADELTYPIHILIRYEIEKDIFNNKIDLNNLDKIWNEKYYKYLGVKPDNDSEGILQDIHWSDASFGYFPTYALGSAIGAQLFYKMNKDLNVDELLENNKFKVITDYLKDNLQQYGALYNYDELLLKATGKRFDPNYYIKYLKNKYSKLYNIK